MRLSHALDKIFDSLEKINTISDPESKIFNKRRLYILMILSAILGMLYLATNFIIEFVFETFETRILMLSNILLITSIIILSILMILYVINPLNKLFEFKKGVEEELPYILLIASSSPFSGDEMGFLIKNISSRPNVIKIFRFFGRIALKTRNLAIYTGFTEAFKIVSELTPSTIYKRFVRNYINNRSLGIQREYLLLVSEDFYRDIENKIRRLVSVKINILTISLVIYTIIPIITSSLSVLQGERVILLTNFLLIISSIFILLITPGHPLPLKTMNEPLINRLKILEYSSFFLLYMLLIIFLTRSFYNNLFIQLLEIFILNHLDLYLLITLFLSIPSLVLLIRIFREVSVTKEVLTLSLAHIKVFKELNSFDATKILLKRGYKRLYLWIGNYIMFVIEYMREISDLASDLYEKFCYKILDLFSVYKNYMIQMMMTLPLVFLEPILFREVFHIVGNELIVLELLMSSIIMTSSIASKIIFDDHMNGLIGSIILILFIKSGGVLF